jgi:cellulose synthase/poly-beta-1,6-N-acetylglucosamine synthase-like glycosyltransferase
MGILLYVYGIIMLYYRYGWVRSHNLFQPNDYRSSTRFSIIIAARNEEKNIGACLDAIHQLNYPKALYEIIVIDDHSEDKTADIVASYNDVTLLYLSDHIKDGNRAYKKQALSLGISKSSGDYIVTTDADCIVPKNWLRCFDLIIQQKSTAFIAAPVMIQKEKNILQIFESLDFMMLQGITAAAVSTGLHTMSNGANLCYRKSAFEKVGGFAEVDGIASGDDMLLMQKIKQSFPNEIHYCKSREAIVTTVGAENLSSFIRQRIRWASKGKYYKEHKLKLILLSVFLLNFFLLLLMIGHLLYAELFFLLCISLCIKMIAELIFLIPVSLFYNKEKILPFFILLQPVHIFYMVIAAFLGYFTKYHWKGRVVR